MRHLAMRLIVFLAGAGLSASRGYAQHVGEVIDFSVGGGVSVPTGAFDEAAELGWHAMAAVRVFPENWPVALQVDGSFSRLSDKSALDIQSQLVFGTGDVLYEFRDPEEQFEPYLIGGVGVYNLDASGDDVPKGVASETAFGLNAGAGFDFMVGAAELFIEGRFHTVFNEGTDTQLIPITLGIRFGRR